MTQCRQMPCLRRSYGHSDTRLAIGNRTENHGVPGSNPGPATLEIPANGGKRKDPGSAAGAFGQQPVQDTPLPGHIKYQQAPGFAEFRVGNKVFVFSKLTVRVRSSALQPDIIRALIGPRRERRTAYQVGLIEPHLQRIVRRLERTSEPLLITVNKRGVRIRRLLDLVCERADLASREYPGERLAEPVVARREIEGLRSRRGCARRSPVDLAPRSCSG